MSHDSASGVEAELRSGSIIGGRYRIERLVGRGGTARVFAAHDEQGGATVAIKILRTELAQTISRDRFVREVELTRLLDHPNVLPILDAGGEGDVLWCVMPLVSGRNLAAHLTRERQLTLQEMVRIVRAVAGALDAAHAQRIVHRDVKPENILLEDEQVWLADFGIARAIVTAGGQRLTLSGIAIGTPMYMSPEQAGGSAELDGRSDQYSLACVAYELIAGVPPFRGATPQVVARQRLMAPPQDIRLLRSEVPDAVAEVLGKALSATPVERYGRVGEFGEALEGAVHQTAGRSGATPMARPRRRPLVAAGLLAGTLAATGLAWLAATARATTSRVDDRAIAVSSIVVDSGASSVASTSLVTQFLVDALARWEDLRLDPLGDGARGKYVVAAKARARPAAGEPRYALQLTIWRVGDSAHVRAIMSDLRRPLPSMTVVTTSRASASELSSAVQSAVDALVRKTYAPHLPSRSSPNSRMIRALQLYDSGWVEMEAWNLRAAATVFGAARAIDGSFAQAALREALAISWTVPFTGMDVATDSARLHEAARVAAAPGAALDASERWLAVGVRALAAREYPSACAAFDRAAERDSTDLSALLGAGECRRRDHRVVRDSRTGAWRFRASYHAAIHAYERAMQVVPEQSPGLARAAFTRLPDVLMVDPSAIRVGRDEVGGTYAAYPALVSDTFAFLPVPLARFSDGDAGVQPERIERARARANQLLRGIASAWAGRLPQQPDVHELYALALENAALYTDESGGPSVAREVAIVERVSTDSLQRLRAAIMRVRVALKRGVWPLAAQIADSLLSASVEMRGEGALRLAPVAALLGRRASLRSLLARSAEGAVSNATEMEREAFYDAETSLSLATSVSDASPALREATTRVHDPKLVSSLCVMATSAYASIGATPLHEQPACGAVPLLAAQAALASGDHERARRIIATLVRRRGDALSPSLSVDAVAAEASAVWALGDREGARMRVAAVLRNLDRQGVGLLSEPWLAAGVVRLLALDATWGSGASAREGRSSYQALVALRGTGGAAQLTGK